MAHGKSLERYPSTVKVTHVGGQRLGFIDKNTKEFVATPKEMTVDRVRRPNMNFHDNKEHKGGNREVNPTSYNKKHTRGRQLVTQTVPAKEVVTGSRKLGTHSVVKVAQKLIRRLKDRFNPVMDAMEQAVSQ